MEQTELERLIEAVLFAAGEPVPASRLAFTAEVDEQEIHTAAKALMDRYAFERRGIRVLKLGDDYQLCSAGEFSGFVTRALETRKLPKLSAAQLETLTVIAYYQPATRAYVDQIRGVDSAYSVGALLTKKLIEECGRLNVPGRPILYRTTPDFLRTFGLSSLNELPEIEKMNFGKKDQLEMSDLPIQESAPETGKNPRLLAGEGDRAALEGLPPTTDAAAEESE